MTTEVIIGLSKPVGSAGNFRIEFRGLLLHIHANFIMGRLHMTVGAISGLATLVLVALILHADPANATSRILSEHHYHEPRTHHLFWTVVTTNVTINNGTVAISTVNGTLPGPTVHINEGDTLIVRVTSEVNTDLTIHW